ncbi:MAG TPA: ABC transporter permease [Rectinemataceae bacterium]|nr:ABC transporter permease [Rectinemataceae bacterium]
MRFFAVFVKFLRESIRDWAMLALALGFAPFFVLLFHVAYQAQPTAMNLAVVDEEAPGGGPGFGKDLVGALRAFRLEDASLRVKVEVLGDRRAAIEKLREGTADLVLVAPEGFSAAIMEGRAPRLVLLGDMASAKYAILVAYAYSAAESLVGRLEGRAGLIDLREISVRPEAKMKPFDAIIPSLIIISLMTVLFTAAALFVREAEKGTILRLRLSRLTALEYLGAAALSQLLVSVSCVFLTLLTAMALGYRLESPLPGILLASSLAGFSVIAFGLLTAGFCASVKDVMIVGNFPYLFMLLFSGVIPIPSPILFTLAGRPIGLSSLFPMSFGVKALEGMMNYGRRPAELGFELGAMALLSVFWFALGLVLYGRRHLGSRSG